MTLSSRHRDDARTDAAARPLDVLNFVTNQEAQFYERQLQTLASFGVTPTTVAVPGKSHSASVKAGTTGHRSLLDYARFGTRALRHSLGDYDLLHANFGLTAPPAVVQPRLPVVLSLWGSDLLGEYGWVTRRLVPHVDAVIVMSDRMAAELDRECHVIPHGVDLDTFVPRPQAQARAELDWSDSEKHVLFPYPPKREVKDFPRAERVVDRARDRLDESITLQTISDVPHSEMPTYMNAADVLLLTSKREGSPNTVKEAMACNTPVVATAVGDVPERLDGVTPSAVGRTDPELVDGLVEVLRADERSNGRDHARDLSLERMGERIRTVYDDVLDEAR
ncbi:glycosyltransferase (plasmid) [Halorientalis pallida]|uniref:glycosyltransferase n=1 Tax=Halorientalis pallida TaxID=2479928 RepID=UPI003C6F165C